MYKVDGRNAQILLGYEDVFHEKAPDLITEIKNLICTRRFLLFVNS